MRVFTLGLVVFGRLLLPMLDRCVLEHIRRRRRYCHCAIIHTNTHTRTHESNAIAIIWTRDDRRRIAENNFDSLADTHILFCFG